MFKISILRTTYFRESEGLLRMQVWQMLCRSHDINKYLSKNIETSFFM